MCCDLSRGWLPGWVGFVSDSQLGLKRDKEGVLIGVWIWEGDLPGTFCSVCSDLHRFRAIGGKKRTELELVAEL